MGTSRVADVPKRSRWSTWALGVLGAVAGAMLVASELVTQIRADRDHQSLYQFTVTVFSSIGPKVFQ